MFLETQCDWPSATANARGSNVRFDIVLYEQRIAALREEQKYYEGVLRNMDAQLASLHSLRELSETRFQMLSAQVEGLKGERRDLQDGPIATSSELL